MSTPQDLQNAVDAFLASLAARDEKLAIANQAAADLNAATTAKADADAALEQANADVTVKRNEMMAIADELAGASSSSEPTDE